MKDSGIYIITNKVNNKQYVGLDSNLPKRANEHLRGKSRCPAIGAAIKKYERDNFTVEIIRYPNVPRQILCWFERSHIAEQNTKAPNGYNLTDGGEGAIGRSPSANTREKLSDARRGKTHTAETKAKLSKAKRGENNPAKRHEVREKVSKAKRGKKASAETRAKMSKARRGKTLSAETKTKMSKVKRQRNLEKRGQGTLF